MGKASKKAKAAQAAVAVPNARETLFKANFLGYLFHKLGLFLINILTLGLGTPAAVCRKNKYLAKHAIIEGNRLKFTGKGGQLFFKNIGWNILSVLTLGLFLLVKRVKMEKWVIKHTRFKDKNEVVGKSMFTAGGGGWLGLCIKNFFISLITLGIAFPVTLVWTHKFFVNHTIISGKQLCSNMKAGDAYKFVIKVILLTIVTLGLYVFYLPLAVKKFQLKHINVPEDDYSDNNDDNDAIENYAPVEMDSMEEVKADVADMTFEEIERLSSNDLDVDAYISEYAKAAGQSEDAVRGAAINRIKHARLAYNMYLDKYLTKHRKGKAGAFFGGLFKLILAVAFLGVAALSVMMLLKEFGIF